MRLIDRVKADPRILMNYSTPPRPIQEAAINISAESIRYIRNPSNHIQVMAVAKGGYSAYKLISSPTYPAKVALIKKQPTMLTAVGFDYDEINKIAVEGDPIVIHKIPSPSYELQRFIIDKKPSYVSRINNVHPDIISEFLEKNPRNYNVFKSIPYSIEKNIINANSKDYYRLTDAFLRFTNPTPRAQELYIRKMMFLTHKNFTRQMLVNVGDRISDEHKEMIMSRLDFEEMTAHDFRLVSDIFKGNEYLMSVLTLVQ